jgi:uncharacterized protein
MAKLDLRPNCECCDKDLPPQSVEAMICTFECTFCSDCVEQVLQGVCPNCGGNFVPRPIRPIGGAAGGLKKHPASSARVYADQPCKQPIIAPSTQPH